MLLQFEENEGMSARPDWNAVIRRIETADPRLRCYMAGNSASHEPISVVVWRDSPGLGKVRVFELAGCEDTAIFAALVGYANHVEGLKPDELAPSSDDRCPFCDRAVCRRWAWAVEYAKGFPGYSASTIYEWTRGNRDDLDDCADHRHAWRPEALSLRAWKEQALALAAAAEASATTRADAVRAALAALDRALGDFYRSGFVDGSTLFHAGGAVAGALRAALEGAHEVVEMRLCESRRLALRPDVFYRFTIAPGCQACAEANEPYMPSTSEEAARAQATAHTSAVQVIVEAAKAWAGNAGPDAPWIRSESERALVSAVRALPAEAKLTRYVRCDRAQVPDGARANAWSTPAAADAAKTLHDKNLNEHGWAIESLLHPLSADARDDADNMHDYPHAVVDVESIADPAVRTAFLAAVQGA